VIQGFGAVGAAAARRVVELGGTVVAVSSSLGGTYDPDGLDVDALLSARAEHGDAGVAGSLRLGEELSLRADVLVPAATQDVIDARCARDLRFDVIVEGANLPIRPDALEVLAGRGVTVVPDFIANAGGVIAAAYAMEGRHSPFPIDPDAIFAAVSQKMRANTDTVLEAAERDGVTSHEAARTLAADRVRTAMRLKGRLPEFAL
jgi:glutamate dehydrogenase (NAD(P)+)